MIRKTLTTAILLGVFSLAANAQQTKEFKTALDSMQTLLKERTSVWGNVKASKVVSRAGTLDFHFTSAFGDYPWRDSDVRWFKKTLKTLLPSAYRNSSVGELYVGKNKIESYIMPSIGNDGSPISSKFRAKDHRGEETFILKVGGQEFSKGLSGRSIALWQSHGRYYEEKTQRWEWQRAPLLQTVEDMYTQSYVLPFLIPMLENAGAYVMTPRERDPQTNEIIADNDSAFEEGRGKGVRLEGRYSESGTWSDAGVGFADFKAVYTKGDNPFRAGSARKASCLDHKGESKSEARWTPDIPERGEYSVYIAYKTLPNSTDRAHYTVKHLGGQSEFLVNQRMGGGTWIYLGTFEFDKGNDGCVILDNLLQDGHKGTRGAVVTADAVRFGGGMGKVARGQKDQDVSEYLTSGLPSFTEGAYYWMQWAGADSTLLNLHDDDYTSDYADRGAWVGWMSGGSRVNPDEEGLGIPVDLSFAFHTDAGTTPDDSIIGTLSIYTLLCEGSDKLPNGEPRAQQRMYADFVQSQIVDDIRRTYNPQWSRRGLWDRSYSESRTPRVPAMLLELLSHQNFADMKFGQDPSFRFAVSRSIYKGMLKFLSSRYGCPYAVQPLPVNSFSTSFRIAPVAGNAAQIRLSWKATPDSLEATAAPTGYILQTRIDDGAFDEGQVMDFRSVGDKCTYDLTIKPGKVYSYRIIAFNEGGRSFPSEALSIGVPLKGKGKSVAVVNNFTRVSPPAWFDTPQYAGFTNGLDAGVPYIREINFIGPQYQFRRELPWMDDDNPGFGASFTDQAGKLIQGNTFDYTSIHGKAVLASGHPFHSLSAAALMDGACPAGSDMALDLICGKQVTTIVGSGKVPSKYQVFPEAMQKALADFTAGGGNLIVSGANIGTDVWDRIYPVDIDSLYTVKTKDFVQKTLGYKWMTNYASNAGALQPVRNDALSLGEAEFWKEGNPFIYNVETPDGIVPATEKSRAVLRYSDTAIGAGVCFEADTYKTACFGFPIEVLKGQEAVNALIGEVLSYFERK